MKSFLHSWIFVMFSCLIRGVHSSRDYRKRLCVPSSGFIGSHPQKYACDRNYGILVNEISMTTSKLDEKCEDDDDSQNDSSEGLPINIHAIPAMRNESRIIELFLKQACNGQRKCDFQASQPSPISVPEDPAMAHYETYVVTYTCQPVKPGNQDTDTIFDISSNITTKGPKGQSVLFLRTKESFYTECVMTANEKKIDLNIIWVDYNMTSMTWDICFKLLDEWDKSLFDVGCNQTNVREMFQDPYVAFKHIAKIHISGNSGFAWIIVTAEAPYELKCKYVKPDSESPLGSSSQLCVQHTNSNYLNHVPKKSQACTEHFGIFIEDIRMTTVRLDKCTFVDLFTTYDLFRYNVNRTESQNIELLLKQACNGKRQCYFAHEFPSPIIASQSSGAVSAPQYNTYIIKYTCVLTKQGTSNMNGILDVSKDFTSLPQTGNSIMVIESDSKFSRECTINAPDGFIYLDPLWVSFDQSTRRWDACLKIYHDASLEFELGCNDTIVRKAFSYAVDPVEKIAKIHIEGDSGFIWIRVSTNPSSFKITCKHKQTVTDPAPWTTEQTTTENGRHTKSPEYNKTATASTSHKIGKENDSTVIIAVTSTIALLATIVAIVLIIYICYIRKGSSYQRRKSSRRLERQLTQRQQEGQHPRLQSQRQRSLQQQQNEYSTYDVYTYMDEKDFKGSATSCQKDARKPVTLPCQDYSDAKSDPVTYSVNPGTHYTDPGTYSANPGKHSIDPGTYSANPGKHSIDPGTYSANPGTHSNDTGTYSTGYSFVSASTTKEGEYDQFGVFHRPITEGKRAQDEPNQTSDHGGLYNTTSPGTYAHFNDNKTAKVVGNFYDG